MSFTRTICPAVALSALFALPGQAAPGAYAVTDLGTLGLNDSSGSVKLFQAQSIGPFSITGDRIAGAMRLIKSVKGRRQGVTHGFVLAAGKTTDIGSLADAGGTPFGSSEARAVNAVGQVAGQFDTAGAAATHAFLWAGGMFTDLGSLGGDPSGAMAINRAGQVVGYAFNKDDRSRAFLFSAGRMRDIGTLGGDGSEADAINDRGEAAGWAETAAGVRHAFLYAGGRMTDLGTLTGDRGDKSAARAINDAGQIVGQSDTTHGGPHAFLYAAGRMTDLGTLGGDASEATGINDRGLIVGESDVDDDHTGDPLYGHAFLYVGGRMRDLNHLLPAETRWQLLTAYAISSRGAIVGMGLLDGHLHAYLLTPRR